MRNSLTFAVAVTAFVSGFVAHKSASQPELYVFSNGQKASAAEVNHNFDALKSLIHEQEGSMSSAHQAFDMRVKELNDEVEKLWASAWRRNRAEISELDKKIVALENQVQLLTSRLKQLETQ